MDEPIVPIVVYRNLNKAKKDKSVFVWSVAASNKNGGKGKVQYHTKEIVLANPRAILKPGALKRIRDGGTREVGAWIAGNEPTQAQNLEIKEALDQQWEGSTVVFPITINPLPESKGGRSEVEFMFCGSIGGIPIMIGDPVDFAEVLAVSFLDNGCFVIMKPNPNFTQKD